MSDERWQTLEQIFDQARVLHPEERGRYLDSACGADETLKSDALSLLTAADESGEFMTGVALERVARLWASGPGALKPGERIGAYTVIDLLGSGGAGEVWRARDERLGRDVALKALLPHFASDRDRLRRFVDEARTAGALNHSNILTVYDVGEHNGIPFIVSECLEGQSLRQRLGSGAMPARQAVDVAIATARGLAAAHARGIVHRDLKPENLFLRADGVIKILDFGLAKLVAPIQNTNDDRRPTQSGVILGTAGYMAPEQINGGSVDARTDLFALGVILYEMLSGRHPFKGASIFETLHAVLTVDPADLATVADVPEPLARVVMRAIRKSPNDRFQSSLDLMWALEQSIVEAPAIQPGRAVPRGNLFRRAAWIALPIGAAAVILALTATQLRQSARETVPTIQFEWLLPNGMSLRSAPVVSPDSRHISFVAGTGSDSRLFVWPLNASEPVSVSGSEGARQPFWSADGRALGFFAAGRVLTATWPGGAPTPVASAYEPRGGSWSASGTILIAPDVIMSGVNRVMPDGTSAPVTTVDVDKGDTSHWWPTVLPDGDHFLYRVRSTVADRQGVYLGRTDTSPATPASLLLRTGSDVAYAPLAERGQGALFSVVDGRIEVWRFDETRRQVTGSPRALALAARGGSLFHPVLLSASRDVLAFSEAPIPAGVRMQAVARTGELVKSWSESEAQNWPRISPDGRFMARQRVDSLTNNPDIWVEDLERGTQARITTAPLPDIQAVWSPDGRQLAYVSGNLPGRPGQRSISIASAAGTGAIRTMPCPAAYCEPTDWSRDGKTLLVNVIDQRGRDIWTISVADGSGRPLLAGAFTERDGRFSPDGRHVAYVSEESGRPEVSVRAIAGPERVVISGDGGTQPVWRRDGAELFYVAPDGSLRSVAVKWTGAAPVFGVAKAVNVPRFGFGHWGTQYDVSPDGTRFYFLRPNEDEPPRRIRVVTGWRALLE